MPRASLRSSFVDLAACQHRQRMGRVSTQDFTGRPVLAARWKTAIATMVRLPVRSGLETGRSGHVEYRQQSFPGSLATLTSLEPSCPCTSTTQTLVSLTETSNVQQESARLLRYLLMREAVHPRTSFHHQPEAQHSKPPTIHNRGAGRLPHLDPRSGQTRGTSAATLRNRRSPFTVRRDGQVPWVREQRRLEAIDAADGAMAGRGSRKWVGIDDMR